MASFTSPRRLSRTGAPCQLLVLIAGTHPPFARPTTQVATSQAWAADTDERAENYPVVGNSRRRGPP